MNASSKLICFDTLENETLWRLSFKTHSIYIYITSKRHKKGLKWHSKNAMDSLTKKNANSEPTHFSWLIYRLLAEYNTMWSRISHPVSPVVGADWSYGKISTHAISHWYGGISQQSTEKQVSKDTLYKRDEHNGLCHFPY